MQVTANDLTDPAKVQAFQAAAAAQRARWPADSVEAHPQLQSQATFRTLMDQIEGSNN